MSIPVAVRKRKLSGLFPTVHDSFINCFASGDVYYILLTGTKAESPSRAVPYDNIGTNGIWEKRPMSFFSAPIFLIV